MIDRGIKLLDNRVITTAITNLIGSEVVPVPHAINNLTFQANFIYGSGGTTAKAYVQTTLDNGATWIDIACFSFTTASARKVQSLHSQTSIVASFAVTDGTLTDDTGKDGVLGDRLRVKLLTTGTYAGNTRLDLRMMIN